MSKRRPSGDGMVRKREDGRWEGRIVIGHKGNGASIFRYIYADTQKELTAKLPQNINAYQGVDLTEESKRNSQQRPARHIQGGNPKGLDLAGLLPHRTDYRPAAGRTVRSQMVRL